MKTKMIRISEDLHEQLTNIGKKGNTYEDIIRGLLKTSERKKD